MKHEEAKQLANGYSWGREDATGTATYSPPVKEGGSNFADAFAAGHAEYNIGRHYHMIPVRTAYERWQATQGESLFPEDCCTRPHYLPVMTLVETTDGSLTGRVLSSNAQGLIVRWHANPAGIPRNRLRLPQIQLRRYEPTRPSTPPARVIESMRATVQRGI